jgi:hypothetical protein
MKREPYRVEYEFRFEDGGTRSFDIHIDPQRMEAIRPPSDSVPEWTRLAFKRCPCCSLTEAESPGCPIARNIAEIVEEFKDTISHKDCTVVCRTPERTYMKECTVAEGLASVFGLLNATSGCPTMGLFKPMARFHLPFSTTEETVARSTSMYLLGQYFVRRRHGQPDLDLKKLDEHFSRVRQVDACLLARIRSVSRMDADDNALVALHAMADILSLQIEYKLGNLEYLFADGTEQDETS